MPDPDEVTITIGAHEFAGFDEFTLESSVDNLADGFVFTAPFDPSNADWDAQTDPFKYQGVQIKIGGELALTGILDKPKFVDGVEASTVTLEGRSLSGQLIDCSIDASDYEFTGLKLSEIARKLCKPFGIAVVVGVDTVEKRVTVNDVKMSATYGGRDYAYNETVLENTLQEAKAKIGQKAYDFLNSLANRKRILLTSDPSGRLVLRQPAGTSKPVGAIIAGTSPYISGEATYDGSARFSLYKVLYQEPGTPDVIGEASDPGVRLYRPLVDTESESEALDTVSPVQFVRAHALAKCVGITVTLAGWRNAAGLLWRKTDVVTLLAPKLKVKKESAFVVAGVTLKKSAKDGKTAVLRLVLPGTYTGQLPGSYPWA